MQNSQEEQIMEDGNHTSVPPAYHHQHVEREQLLVGVTWLVEAGGVHEEEEQEQELFRQCAELLDESSDSTWKIRYKSNLFLN